MRITALLLLSVSLSFSVAAQSPEESETDSPRWYQIEVLFFRNLAEPSQEEENWPNSILLEMPESSYELPLFDDASPSTQAFAEWAPPSPLPTIIELPPLEEEFVNEGYQSEQNNSSTALGQQAAAGSGVLPGDEIDIELDIPTWRQYQGVAEDETKLETLVASLKRRSDLEILDVRAWRQPLLADAAPMYFRVEAGQQYGRFRELEGYIGFSLKRYLHVDAQLWWSDYTPPLVEADSGAASPITNPVVAPEGEVTQEASITTSHIVDSQEVTIEERDMDDTGIPGPDSVLPVTEDLFEPRSVARAAHIKEQRRMRSEEVHYFDHPLIGVLVLISPWDDTSYDEFADRAKNQDNPSY